MLPHSWRRFLAIVRLILGISCLTIQLMAFNFALTDAVAMFAAYIAYAAAAVIWKGIEDTRYSMFALAFDFLFFLLAAVAPVPMANGSRRCFTATCWFRRWCCTTGARRWEWQWHPSREST